MSGSSYIRYQQRVCFFVLFIAIVIDLFNCILYLHFYFLDLTVILKLSFQKHEILVSMFVFPKINILIALHMACRQRWQFSCVVPWKKDVVGGCYNILQEFWMCHHICVLMAESFQQCTSTGKLQCWVLLTENSTKNKVGLNFTLIML